MKTEKVELEMKDGVQVKGKQIIVETVLDLAAEEVWKQAQKPTFWIDMLDPRAKLKPMNKLPQKWEREQEYTFKLRMYAIIPFGKHHIRFESIDHENHKMQSREHGFLVPHWDNYFELEKLTDSTCIARDVLFISSKGINAIVVAYAKDVLKAKHKRLKKLF